MNRMPGVSFPEALRMFVVRVISSAESGSRGWRMCCWGTVSSWVGIVIVVHSFLAHTCLGTDTRPVASPQAATHPITHARSPIPLPGWERWDNTLGQAHDRPEGYRCHR